MPIYDFRCEECEHKFTVLVGISERDKVRCPQCDSSKIKQLITGCSVKVSGGCGSSSGNAGAGG